MSAVVGELFQQEKQFFIPNALLFTNTVIRITDQRAQEARLRSGRSVSLGVGASRH